MNIIQQKGGKDQMFHLNYSVNQKFNVAENAGRKFIRFPGLA